jgi:hypothetical protein
METPRLYIDDQIEMCDGHADYGHSILYCEHAGKRMEVYRTSYRTNRLNEQMEGIFSFSLERTESEWVVTLKLADGEQQLRSMDGENWR